MGRIADEVMGKANVTRRRREPLWSFSGISRFLSNQLGADESGTIQFDRPLLLVGNPSSKSGRGAVKIEKVRALFKNLGVAYEFQSTLPSGRTADVVSEAIVKQKFQTVVYMGGDGTFNEVAKGICQSGKAREVKLGMLPSGTANDQGKSFGISSSIRALEKNVRTIAKGFTTNLDVGEVTARSVRGNVLRRDLFFDSAGWGLSAAILAFRNHELEMIRRVPVVRDMYRDQMVYIRAALREVALSSVTRDRFNAKVEIDGRMIFMDSLTDLVINNTAVYAGDWIVGPKSGHNDGRFEVVPFRGVRDWTSKLILHHKKVPLTERMVNKIGVSHSPMYSGSRIKIEFEQSSRNKRILAQLDGEEFPPAYGFEIRVHPRMLNIIVPKDFHWI